MTLTTEHSYTVLCREYFVKSVPLHNCHCLCSVTQIRTFGRTGLWSPCAWSKVLFASYALVSPRLLYSMLLCHIYLVGADPLAWLPTVTGVVVPTSSALWSIDISHCVPAAFVQSISFLASYMPRIRKLYSMCLFVSPQGLSTQGFESGI